LQAGYNWVVDADLKSYFDTIPHSALIGRVKEKVADSRVIELLQAFLTQKVMETAEGWSRRRELPKAPWSVRCCPISISTRSTSRWRSRATR
jgi:retron-type reverse transcriptase